MSKKVVHNSALMTA